MTDFFLEQSNRRTAKAVVEFFGGDRCRWTTGTWARDSAGAPVREESPEACCWCLDGALRRLEFLGKISVADRHDFEDRLDEDVGSFMSWQDGVTFADVEQKLREIAVGGVA